MPRLARAHFLRDPDRPVAAAANSWSSNSTRLLEHAKLQSLGELAYGASHEINNPLANISTRAQAMLAQEADPEKRRMLAIINSQAFRANEMIADMMLFARPPALVRQRVDLVALVDTVIAELQDDARLARHADRAPGRRPTCWSRPMPRNWRMALRAVWSMLWRHWWPKGKSMSRSSRSPASDQELRHVGARHDPRYGPGHPARASPPHLRSVLLRPRSRTRVGVRALQVLAHDHSARRTHRCGEPGTTGHDVHVRPAARRHSRSPYDGNA